MLSLESLQLCEYTAIVRTICMYNIFNVQILHTYCLINKQKQRIAKSCFENKLNVNDKIGTYRLCATYQISRPIVIKLYYAFYACI
jgi:hypothetical protein